MDDDKVARLRRADFWTSLVLLAIAGLMLKGALGFPITDSYGGVQNVWYVSPALFPLLVTVALVILACVLLANAIQTGGAAAAIAALGHRTSGWSERQKKLVLMIGLLVGYVYGFIPYVDYVVGTVFFLFAFVAAFHVVDPTAARRASIGFLIPSLAVALIGAAGWMPGPGTAAAVASDLLMIGAFALTIALVLARPEARGRSVATTLATALIAPLVLTPAFKYALLVPLPREGVVVGFMDMIRYAFRAALS
ncbi:MAG: hypothetical protein AAFX81_12605 [Pseudomonadota bacterium]